MILEQYEPVYNGLVKHDSVDTKLQSDTKKGRTCTPIQSRPQTLWPA